MNCPYCAKDFTPRAQYPNQVYCSDGCRVRSFQRENPTRPYEVRRREIALVLSGTDAWLAKRQKQK